MYVFGPFYKTRAPSQAIICGVSHVSLHMSHVSLICIRHASCHLLQTRVYLLFLKLRLTFVFFFSQKKNEKKQDESLTFVFFFLQKKRTKKKKVLPSSSFFRLPLPLPQYSHRSLIHKKAWYMHKRALYICTKEPCISVNEKCSTSFFLPLPLPPVLPFFLRGFMSLTAEPLLRLLYMAATDSFFCCCCCYGCNRK